jgi:hypothetical protein
MGPYVLVGIIIFVLPDRVDQVGRGVEAIAGDDHVHGQKGPLAA